MLWIDLTYGLCDELGERGSIEFAQREQVVLELTAALKPDGDRAGNDATLVFELPNAERMDGILSLEDHPMGLDGQPKRIHGLARSLRKLGNGCGGRISTKQSLAEAYGCDLRPLTFRRRRVMVASEHWRLERY
jgi:hypothetical protein